ncbi:hypothetical protein [uncultured Gimesia sp.]|mgnify:CR=1 FL=1|uniref:hypothetical protein n=1 Tax=uncultured Gimesia sp. TaxID=1678688 RepID=UPI0030DD2305|tara:strand:+ start:40221 stop:40655 length:435 start_codon:yes stop_codon:yes gene_type:complete
MRTVVKLVLIVIVIALVRFNQQSKKDRKIEPFEVTENNGAVHSLYRELDLKEVTKTLPSGAVDAIDVDARFPKHVIAIVTVPFAEGEPLQFQTTFTSSDGKTIVKNWQPAEGNRGPNATGLFLVSDKIISGTTKVDVPSADSRE